MRNLLLDPLQTSVILGVEEVPIFTSFRNSILFELLMSQRNISAKEKVIEAIRLYYPSEVHNIVIDHSEKAISSIIDFYAGGTGEKQQNKESSDNRSSRAIFHFEHDAGYIYAAFLSQYGIDLTVEKDLHWHKFKALFHGLESRHKISEIMKIRATEITSEMSKEEQKYYREMKALYRLPDMRTEEEKECDFANALML